MSYISNKSIIVNKNEIYYTNANKNIADKNCGLF